MVGGAACAGGDDASPNGDPDQPPPVSLHIWNRSQFELLDMRVHFGEAYAGAPNLLTEALAVEAEITFEVDVGSRVTVIRRKIDVGDTIALTTSRGLDEIIDGSTLIVFDEAFRLMRTGAR